MQSTWVPNAQSSPICRKAGTGGGGGGKDAMRHREIKRPLRTLWEGISSLRLPVSPASNPTNNNATSTRTVGNVRNIETSNCACYPQHLDPPIESLAGGTERHLRCTVPARDNVLREHRRTRAGVAAVPAATGMHLVCLAPRHLRHRSTGQAEVAKLDRAILAVCLGRQRSRGLAE